MFGNDHSYTYRTGLSGNGRYVFFESEATNLVPNDTNGVRDIFRLDTQTGQVIRVNVNNAGNQATGGASNLPSANFDGSKVAFFSAASNLVSGDNNNASDIFIRDLNAGTTVRVSVDSSGNEGNFSSQNPDLNAAGDKVAFHSYANNLVSGDTNNVADVFLRDLTAGTTVRVSLNATGGEVFTGGSFTPDLNVDGTKVAFVSDASDMVSSDTNSYSDIFVRDLVAGTTVRVSVSSLGAEGTGGYSSNPSLTDDGTKVFFQSGANNLVPSDTNGVRDVFVRDLSAGTTSRVSVDSSGNQATGGESTDPSITPDGTKCAFQSGASNLVAGDTGFFFDCFIRDLSAGTTTRVSVSNSGAQANSTSAIPTISADGSRVAFCSLATNLVAGDSDNKFDVFVRDVSAGTTSVPVTVSGFSLD